MPGQSGSAAPFNAKYVVQELSPELPNAVLFSGLSPAAHSATHESGASDALDGTHGIEAIKLVSGNRFYFKDSAGSNVASIDESGNLRIKGSVYENQSSV